ncbi:MAG: ABC-2 transporter permease, partial [Eubacteriales bacterium]
MRGLIQKDLCLLLQRSRILLVLIGTGALMGFSTDSSFVIGYLTMICAILTVGTISYDEFDNGYPFLLTLPITKRTYVMGKYLFCMLGGLTGWCIAVVLFLGCTLIKGNAISTSDLLETIAFIPVLGLITALLLPLQLKYGAEKSRLAIAVVGGGAWALGYFVMKYLPDHPVLPSELDGLTMMVFLL